MTNPNKIVIEAANGTKPNPIINNLIVSGATVYLAGVLGTDASGQLVSGGVKAETIQSMRNATERLSHVNLDLSDVVSITIFICDYGINLPNLNEVYGGCFPEGASMPVRTAVGVAALPLNAAAEFSIIAVKRP
ncbi:YjgF-like protein [Cutaneotrichosporon oleaginosum]|uniref:YjgF-like protein n=1 Tax=Cutaneotrichosporon oleaginosum TaxID=879819 RepID=A0A0J0XR26_9TREE|nr:YjgF-like protein [Cutaneotrichosporon oleaginosum]KLT43530.1 YjgF-like protein [Cutaneotrichosporon oleaginosum]